MWFGLVMAAAAALAQPAWAQEQQEQAAQVFSIPAQPLASALERYGDATGREAFYDAELARGRTSGPVDGTLSPREALERLLAGTGLVARHMPDSSFVLLPGPAGERKATSPAHRRYYALIQSGLRDAFCDSEIARPGRFRLVALFWIGPAGAVLRAQRLGSAGQPELDRRIDATLRTVRVDEPPPPGFEQPVLIMVVPQAPGVTIGCDDARTAARPLRSAR